MSIPTIDEDTRNDLREMKGDPKGRLLIRNLIYAVIGLVGAVCVLYKVNVGNSTSNKIDCAQAIAQCQRDRDSSRVDARVKDAVIAGKDDIIAHQQTIIERKDSLLLVAATASLKSIDRREVKADKIYKKTSKK